MALRFQKGTKIIASAFVQISLCAGWGRMFFLTGTMENSKDACGARCFAMPEKKKVPDGMTLSA